MSEQTWNTWDKQVTVDGEVTWEPLSKVRKSGTDEEKQTRQRFARMMKCRLQAPVSSFWDECACDEGCANPHARVGQGRRDGTEVTVIGTTRDLHGPDGVCTCCHGRAS